MGETIPLAERKIDYLFIGYWVLNLSFITYIVDIEQLVIADPSNFEYPLWHGQKEILTRWLDQEDHGVLI